MNSENPTSQKNSDPNTKSESDEHAAQTQPVVSPIEGRAKPEAPPPTEKCIQSKCTEKHWLDYLEAGMGGLGLVVLVVYTIFTGLMYCANRDAADAAAKAANVASDTLKMTYRPRLAISKLRMQDTAIQSDGRTAFTFNILNYGPIAATIVKVFRFDQITDIAHALRQPYGEPLRDYPKFWLPNISDGAGIYGKEPLSKEQIDSISRRNHLPLTPENAQKIIVFSVLIEYQGDSSTEVHHTEMCVLSTLGPEQWNSYCPWTTQLD